MFLFCCVRNKESLQQLIVTIIIVADVPGVIKFFGKICIHNGPRFIIEIFSEFVPVVIQMLLHSQDMKQVAIETIGVVGKTAEGKVVLSEQGSFSSSL